MSIIGGLGVPKDNRAFGHGMLMDSRLIFRPRLYIRWDDGLHKIERIMDLTFLARRMLRRENLSEGRKAHPKVEEIRIRPEIRLKSVPRKVSKISI